MQLLVLLFLLFGGMSGRNLNEVKPILEEIGGEEMKSAIDDAEKIYKEAEQIQSMITAVRAACGADGGSKYGESGKNSTDGGWNCFGGSKCGADGGSHGDNCKDKGDGGSCGDNCKDKDDGESGENGSDSGRRCGEHDCQSHAQPRGAQNCGKEGDCEYAQYGFPLAPVSSVADEGILFCLSRYMALGD